MKQSVTLPRDKSALVLIDLQEEHRGDPRYLVEGYEEVLANAARLLATARSAGMPVLHFAYIVDPETARPFHPKMEDGRSAFSDRDDPLSAICAEVQATDGETVIVKTEASAFGDGQLTSILKERGIEWIVVAGVWTEACIDATVKHAVSAGFRVMLVKDACGSATAAMHQTGILNLANRLYGGAVVATDSACRAMGGQTVEGWRVQGAVPLRITYENAAALYAGL